MFIGISWNRRFALYDCIFVVDMGGACYGFTRHSGGGNPMQRVKQLSPEPQMF